VSATNHLPGQHLDSARMPGHWLLSRLGKRVLRPGGLELTRQMLEALNILAEDDVIEFGPGLGMTARIALGRKPRSYAGIERDETAARIVRSYLMGPHQSCFVASAEETGLTTGQASVIYGEAMLTMQGPRQKASMIKEAARLLRPGGRYGIHELCLVPDALPQQTRDLIEGDLSPNFGGKKYLERSEPENQKHEVPT
jgi:SAM-dependent methyltransferase